MKRTLFIASLILFLLFCLTTNVFAAGNTAKIGNAEYETLDKAISAAGTAQTTITLIDNIDLSGKLSFPKGSNIVLDLNGQSLDVPTIENNYGIVVAGNLTIKGKGTVTLGMYGIGVSATGNLTIEDGTYKCQTGDYLLGSWGTATIKGGLFDGNYCIANGFDGGTVKILDGTFYSKESTIVLGGTEIFGGTFNHNVDDYLAEGIEMNQYNGLYYTGKMYKITVAGTKNGVVETLAEAVAEQPVKVTTKPNNGYEIEQIKVTSAEGKIIAVASGEFVMPSSDVVVAVTFEKVSLDNTPTTGGIDIIVIVYTVIALVSLAIIIAKRKIEN